MSMNAELHALQRIEGTKPNQWCAITSPDALLSLLFVSLLLRDPSQIRATLSWSRAHISDCSGHGWAELSYSLGTRPCTCPPCRCGCCCISMT